MTIAEIRRANILTLIDEYAGGNVSIFARKVYTSPSVIFAIISDWPSRNCGTALARRIERSINLPTGYLDAGVHGRVADLYARLLELSDSDLDTIESILDQLDGGGKKIRKKRAK